MSDYDTRRVGEIVVLEEKILHLQEQLREYKADADKWAPQTSSEMGDNGSRITLRFGGKLQTATMSFSALEQTDETTMTSAVLDTFKDFLSSQLRPFIQAEVVKLQAGARAKSKAGKW
jgi:hypothetical protein